MGVFAVSALTPTYDADRQEEGRPLSEPHVKIRPMRAGDGVACARLWREFGRALAERMPSRFREPKIEGLSEWFDRGIAESGPLVLRALAEVERESVGLIHAFLRPPHDPPGASLMFEQLETRVVLDDIVVLESLRGRGIGEALVRYVEEWGRGHGAKVMLLNSDPGGPARRFYERLGFQTGAVVYSKEL